ncbi:MAG: hypothetical protein ACNA8W_03295 [Bradymonadaceae bacterium]
MNDQKQTPSESPGISERAHDAREKIREFEHTYDETRHQLQRVNEQAVAFIKENPGWCIIGAVTAGYLIGRLASKRWLV